MNAEQIKIIEPSRGWLSLNLGEVWRYRELLQLFTLHALMCAKLWGQPQRVRSHSPQS